MTRITRVYSRAEQWMDRIVHWCGITGAVVGVVAMMIVAGVVAHGDALLWASLVVYSVGLVGMLGCSALCNHDLTDSSHWAGLFQRLDHAGILLMIAATYTPLTLHVMGGTTGWILFAFVWLIALTGMAIRLFRREPLKPRSSLALYLVLGWSVVFALQPLVSSASLVVLVLILVGGGLYSVGVPFYLWKRLPFHNAIWHAFVVAAAACHYAAVLIGVALTGGVASSS